MGKDNYELVKAKELTELRKEMDAMKTNPFVTKSKGEELVSSVDGLRQSLDQMLDIFKKASDEMTLEEKEERMIARQIKPLLSKIDQIVDQNETIAQGMVTIAERSEQTQKTVEEMQKQLNTMMAKLSDISHAQFMSQHEAPMSTASAVPMMDPQPAAAGLPPLTGGPAPGGIPPLTEPIGGGLPPPDIDMSMPQAPPNAIPPLGPNELEGKSKKKGFNLFKK